MNAPGSRHIVLVSGPPGSGKSTLARPLAESLGYALLAKDDIKESLYGSLGAAPGDREASRRMGAVAMDLLWALAVHCPAVVLEANFRTHSALEREQVAVLLRQPGARLVEVHCRVPLEEASRRFAERARQERHHPAHPLAEMSPEAMAAYSAPFALSPVIAVDTTRPVEIEALAAEVRAALR